MTTHLVRFDWAMKYLLRDKKNFDVLEGFLSELLQQDIYILSIIESESNQKHKADKFNRVDLMTETLNKEKIIIEIQCLRQFDYLNRILYGTSKAITESIDKGEPYSKINRVISISILYFNLGEGEDYIYKGETQFTGLHRQDTLQLTKEDSEAYKELGIKTPQDIFPQYYLIKVNQFADQRIKDGIDEWMYLLKNAAIKKGFKAKGIQAAAEKLRKMQLDDEERKKYDRYIEDLSYEASMIESHYGRGMRCGIAQGEAQGKLEGKLETAANLLKMGMDYQQVAQATGLSVEELKAKFSL